jgi:hypothetical protein
MRYRLYLPICHLELSDDLSSHFWRTKHNILSKFYEQSSSDLSYWLEDLLIGVLCITGVEMFSSRKCTTHFLEVSRPQILTHNIFIPKNRLLFILTNFHYIWLNYRWFTIFHDRPRYSSWSVCSVSSTRNLKVK